MNGLREASSDSHRYFSSELGCSWRFTSKIVQSEGIFEVCGAGGSELTISFSEVLALTTKPSLHQCSSFLATRDGRVRVPYSATTFQTFWNSLYQRPMLRYKWDLGERATALYLSLLRSPIQLPFKFPAKSILLKTLLQFVKC